MERGLVITDAVALWALRRIARGECPLGNVITEKGQRVLDLLEAGTSYREALNQVNR